MNTTQKGVPPSYRLVENMTDEELVESLRHPQKSGVEAIVSAEIKTRLEVANNNVLFAFAHGIYMALKVHGMSIHTAQDIQPVLACMDRIVKTPRASLIKFHDNFNADSCRVGRQIERDVCKEYLRQVTAEEL